MNYEHLNHHTIFANIYLVARLLFLYYLKYINNFILETSKEPYVLFNAVYTLKDATIREWSLLSPNIIHELENFLSNYVINNNKK
jgi:hypothetical protein